MRSVETVYVIVTVMKVITWRKHPCHKTYLHHYGILYIRYLSLAAQTDADRLE